MIRDLVLKNRSYRRFRQEIPIERKSLEELVDLGRLSASAANLQPLKYVLVNDPELCARVFPTLAWAGYLKEWPGPAEGERPTGYIVMLGDKEVAKAFGCDHGIAAQSILLGAAEKGLGGCMIGSVRREELSQILSIDPRFDILLVLALGVPAETVVVETVGEQGDIRYWRDENDGHHVPKRALKDVIVG